MDEKRTVGKNGPLVPMTKWEIYEILITEAHNEMVRCDILNRMHMLMSLKGSNVQMHEQFMGKYQAQVRQSKESMEMLKDMFERDQKDMAETPKPDEPAPVEKPVDKKSKKATLKE